MSAPASYPFRLVLVKAVGSLHHHALAASDPAGCTAPSPSLLLSHLSRSLSLALANDHQHALMAEHYAALMSRVLAESDPEALNQILRLYESLVSAARRVMYLSLHQQGHATLALPPSCLVVMAPSTTSRASQRSQLWRRSV